jgi:hypothetical protein
VRIDQELRATIGELVQKGNGIRRWSAPMIAKRFQSVEVAHLNAAARKG